MVNTSDDWWIDHYAPPIFSARTALLYVKSRYIDPLIPISFSYLKPFLLASYLS